MSDAKRLLVKESLAVKYRPRFLKDMIGQDAVVAKLRGMLKTKNVPNALLLIGPSGTGKTTVARIFNRALNCATQNSCGKCDSCLANPHPDLKEMNFGDTRGIDDIRALVQFAKYKPHNNIRMILGDEAHALTSQAYHALLKPLEEPPPQTLWCLATTNPEKIPDTIVGRCSILELKLPSVEAIASRLEVIAEAEKVQWVIPFLPTIAESSNGHVRDAVITLESVMQYVAGKGGAEKVKDLKAAISEVTRTSVVADDNVAIKILMGMYLKKPKIIHAALLDTENFISVVNKMLYLNTYALDCQLFEGRSTKIWHTATNKKLIGAITKNIKGKDSPEFLARLLSIQNRIVDLRLEMQNFLIAERSLLIARLCTEKVLQMKV